MRLLIDTHVLIWFDLGHPRLGTSTSREIATAIAERRAMISAISVYEVGWLARRGRIRLSSGVEAWRQAMEGGGLRVAPIDGMTAASAADIDWSHGDPIDRILVATALHRDAALATADQAILDWPGRLDRIDARL